ncbi:Hypothetical predicted protein [Pelobates cultripes]|uniref:Uncharacterized protein n=1 Tax=Pelobates cultripes TaxID=61616 RepID=A0AAD1THD8_PELCU|nr:Hypothetical predicted protein [Pelobates cultripes]
MRAHTAIPLKTRYGAGVTRPRRGAYSSLSRGETAAPPGRRMAAGCPPPLDRRGLSRSPRATTTDYCRAQTRARPQNTAQRERSNMADSPQPHEHTKSDLPHNAQPPKGRADLWTSHAPETSQQPTLIGYQFRQRTASGETKGGNRGGSPWAPLTHGPHNHTKRAQSSRRHPGAPALNAKLRRGRTETTGGNSILGCSTTPTRGRTAAHIGSTRNLEPQKQAPRITQGSEEGFIELCRRASYSPICPQPSLGIG